MSFFNYILTPKLYKVYGDGPPEVSVVYAAHSHWRGVAHIVLCHFVVVEESNVVDFM